MKCSNYDHMLDPLERCSFCGGTGYHFSVPDMTPARTTPTIPLTPESSTSDALGRVRAEVMPWLVANATKFMHPDHQVMATLSRQDEICHVLLSLPEAEAAIRQLMQAYANAIGKGLTFCVMPDISGEQR